MSRKTKPQTPAPDATAEPIRAAPARPAGILVPFPAPGTRRRRPAPRAGEARGQILLFLGVRYERLAS